MSEIMVIFADRRYKNARLRTFALSIMITAFGTYPPAAAQSGGMSYVKTVVPIDSSTAQPGDGRPCRATVAYCDGLGRQLGTVQKGYCQDGSDLATCTGYDGRGRVSVEWLPAAVRDDGQGSFACGYQQAASATHGGDLFPYTKKIYDGTAEDRVAEVTGPGEHWRQGGDNHSLRLLHVFNTHELGCYNDEELGGLELSCRYFRMEEDGSISCRCPNNKSCPRYYAPGTLRVELAFDEDSMASATFSDKAGRIVLRRRYRQYTGDPSDTYYVYDDYGRLCCVLPPRAVEAIAGKSTVPDEIIDKWCYRYRYDSRDRCIARKLPGQDETLYIYDKLERMVLSQDGEQRKHAEWSVIAYDRMGRKVLEGRAKLPGATQESLQRVWGSQLMTAAYDPASMMEYDMQYRLDHALNSFVADRAFYYDTYDHWNGLMPLSQGTSCSAVAASRINGRLTGTCVSDFNRGLYVVSATVYDSRGRVARQMSRDVYGQHHSIATTTTHSWTGELDDVTSVTCTLAEQRPVKRHVQHSRYKRDCWGRLLAEDIEVDGQKAVTISSLEYDNLGRVSKSILGGGVTGTEYSYNVRGWLTAQAPVAGSGFSMSIDGYTYGGLVTSMRETRFRAGKWKTFARKMAYDELGMLTDVTDGDSDMFGEAYSYDINGNVLTARHGYYDDLAMTYDGNRLTGMTDKADGDILRPLQARVPSIPAGGHDDAMAYDACGRLTRDDTRSVALITYNPLHLPTRIAFTTGDDINYTHLSDGTRLEAFTRHFYTEQVKRHDKGTGRDTVVTRTRVRSSRRTCLGDWVIEDGRADRLYTSAGYCDAAGDSVSFHYWVKDHLGSVRAIYDSRGCLEQATDYLACGVPVDYGLPPSTSMASDLEVAGGQRAPAMAGAGDGTAAVQPELLTVDVDPHKHCGKELELFSGLGWYYNQARLYDPVLMRFTTLDPLAEKYYPTSPYAYCQNDPLAKVDLDGKDIWDIDENGNLLGCTEDKESDTFNVVFYDKYGEKTITSISFKYGSINKINIKGAERGLDFYTINSGDADGDRLFTFLAKNTKVEWGQAKTGLKGSGTNYIGTSHEEKKENSMSQLYAKRLGYGYRIRAFIHNHHSGSHDPSGIDYSTKKEKPGEWGDMGFKNSIVNDFTTGPRKKTIPVFLIYTSNDAVYSTY
jgi:RHS repeat-associated protein